MSYQPSSGCMVKNDYHDVDELVYRIRECAFENGNKCGESCDCEKNKDKLLEKFNPTFINLLDKKAIYGCYTLREDFEQDLKTRFVELIYEWDDNRGIYFVTYATIMLSRWVLKMNHILWLWNKRKIDNYLMFDVNKFDKDFDKSINDFHIKEYIENMSKHLTDKQRAVLEDRFIHNLMVNEIAARYNVSPGAISNLLKRAYKTLYEILSEQN